MLKEVWKHCGIWCSFDVKGLENIVKIIPSCFKANKIGKKLYPKHSMRVNFVSFANKNSLNFYMQYRETSLSATSFCSVKIQKIFELCEFLKVPLVIVRIFNIFHIIHLVQFHLVLIIFRAFGHTKWGFLY